MSLLWAQLWSEKYQELQMVAMGSRARGDQVRERQALDLLALMDREQQPPADLTGWKHFDGCVICPANHWISTEDDMPSIMAAIINHECDGGSCPTTPADGSPAARPVSDPPQP